MDGGKRRLAVALETRRRIRRDQECECPVAPRRVGGGVREGERGNGKSNAEPAAMKARDVCRK